MLCFGELLAANVLKKKGKEYQKFQSKIFYLTVPKSLVSAQPFYAVFRRISGSESLEKEGEGVSRVSVESFLSHSSEKDGRGTTLLCCFSKSFWQRKSLEKSGREYQKFQSKVFCVTVPKRLVGEQPFCAVFQKISGGEKVLKKMVKEE